MPVAARSAARMVACSWVADPKVVSRSDPFHRTFEPGTKLLPETVRVKAGPPAVATEGFRTVTTGAAGATVRGAVLVTTP
jgi:hypothetical protein